MHASVLQVKMDHQVIDVCIFVQEKNNCFSKDSNENIVKWGAKKSPFNSFEINSGTGLLRFIVFVV